MKKLIIFMAAVLMMSAAFTGCDNSSSSSESGKGKGFTIEAQIEYPENTPNTKLNDEIKEDAYLTADWEGNKNPIKEVEVDIYFGGKKIGEVDFAEDFGDFFEKYGVENNSDGQYDGLHFQLCIPGKDWSKPISYYLNDTGTYTLKIKAEDTKGKDSNTVQLTINYTILPK